MNRKNDQSGIGAWLFNPFQYVAGAQALFLGLLAILAAAYLGSMTNTHFDGVLDIHTGAEAPGWLFLCEGLIDWLCMGGILWGIGKLASKTSFRAIDLFGTQAMARWPTLITAFLCSLSGYTRFTRYIMWRLADVGEAAPFSAADAAVFSAVLVAMIAILVWTVRLMYQSYVISCNLKGPKAVGSFVGGIIAAEILSKIAISLLLIWSAQDQAWKPRTAEPEPKAHFQHEQHYAFDSEDGLELISGDEGMSVAVENGEVRVHGTTTDADWGPEAVKVRVADDGGAIDVSGRFRIMQRGASGLVFLEAETQDGGPLIYMYQWSPLFELIPVLEAYQIQTRWFKSPAVLVSGVRSMRTPGDPEAEFCRMQIHIREDHKTADFFANGVFQDSVVFDESFGPIISAKMELQTPRKGHPFDIRFDDLTVKWNDSPLESARSEMAEKTGGLLLHYTFDEDGEQVEDSSGQQAHGKLNGDPRRVAGVKGEALAWDGQGDYVNVPQTRRLRELLDGDYTLSAWFNPSSVPEKETDGSAIIAKHGSNFGIWYDRERRFRLLHWFRCSTNYEARFEGPETIDGIMAVDVIAAEPSPPHAWYHVVAVAATNRDELALYVNGVLAGVKRWTEPWKTYSIPPPWNVAIAQPQGTLHRWPAHGIIDDVRIYGRALSRDEVQALSANVDQDQRDGLEDSVRVLAEELSDEGRGVRYRASIVLADIGPPANSAVPALTKAAKDIEICAGPVLALGKIGIVNDEIVAVLMDALTHRSKWDRCQGAVALARLNVTSAIPELERLRDEDDDADVRTHAREALRSLQGGD